MAARGWLEVMLTKAVKDYRPVTTSESWQRACALPPGAGRARRYLRSIVRESGLLFGTPTRGAEPESTQPDETRLFRAVLQTFCRIALDVAVLTDAAPGPRPEQMLLLFAAQVGRLDDAEQLHRRIERATREWPIPSKLWGQVEAALDARAPSLGGDPYYGLVLHNGAVYSDANLFARLALAYFSRSTFPRAAAERRVRFAAQQKALLVETLVGLVCAERKPPFPIRRAILQQIDALELPEDLADSTVAFARRAFEKPVSMKKVVGAVRSHDMKRFILEQTLLASVVDGHRSQRELEWTRGLGAQLGFSKDELVALELEMVEFYKQHQDVVDVFTISGGTAVLGEELVDTVSTSLQKNFRRLLRELRETGDLFVLLSRATRGQTLDADEKQRMREQLKDLARAVPALAIFAAPGGVFLLIALAKVLPFELRPSSFRDEDE